MSPWVFPFLLGLFVGFLAGSFIAIYWFVKSYDYLGTYVKRKKDE